MELPERKIDPETRRIIPRNQLSVADIVLSAAIGLTAVGCVVTTMEAMPQWYQGALEYFHITPEAYDITRAPASADLYQ